MSVELQPIPIRPESDVYATYRRIDYKIWYAIAEFVDNSTQNYLYHRAEIDSASDLPPRLIVEIVYDSQNDTLTVSDDANGMDYVELARAVQLNRPPADRAGRCEFGMGLKMAACWLGRRWRVVTKQLGSMDELRVNVDVEALQSDKPTDLTAEVIHGCDPALHYTRIEIEGLYRKYRGKAITRIKEHLASIYRRDLDGDEVTIKWNGEPLSWDSDPIFRETKPDGQIQDWIKPIDLTVAWARTDGTRVDLLVTGNIWIRIPGEARRAGLHLFRRGRLVVGGPGEGFKPQDIFGAPNSFESQRLVGELDLDDWPVTQTKDAFDWEGDLEHEFVLKLREAASDYMDKLRTIKSPDGGQPTKGDALLAADATRHTLSGPEVDTALLIVEAQPPPPEPEPSSESAFLQEIVKDSGEPVRVTVGKSDFPELVVWFLDNRPESEIYVTFACPTDDRLELAVNMNHPFVANVLRRDPEMLQLWAQMLYVDALVERSARRRGQLLAPNAFREFKDVFLRRIKSAD